jgi:hypothetical protein
MTQALNTPWTDVTIQGVPYQIQCLGAEQAFELDAHLLHLVGEGLAASIASGLEGVLPALLLSVAKEFEVAESMEELRQRLDDLMELDLGSPQIREGIMVLINSVSPKVGDLIRETIPTVANRVSAAQVKLLVQICLFRHVRFRDPTGQWCLMTSWTEFDHVLRSVPAGPKRQMHKWALLIRAIQVTWGPSGAAAPTHPVGERQAEAGE